MVFSIFIKLCNHHHYLIWQHSSPQKESQYPLVVTPIPSLPAPGNSSTFCNSAIFKTEKEPNCRVMRWKFFTTSQNRPKVSFYHVLKCTRFSFLLRYDNVTSLCAWHSKRPKLKTSVWNKERFIVLGGTNPDDGRPNPQIHFKEV